MSVHINVEKNRNGQYIWVMIQHFEKGGASETIAQSPGTFRTIEEAKNAAEAFKKAAQSAKVLGVAEEAQR